MLEFNIENRGDDKLNKLQKTICHPDWLKYRKAIQAEYNSFIKNETLKRTTISENSQVITSQ